jgi:hypothetical protein
LDLHRANRHEFTLATEWKVYQKEPILDFSLRSLGALCVSALSLVFFHGA